MTVVQGSIAAGTYVKTESTIRVDLQYNNKAIQMGKTWYCRLKVYSTSGDALKLVYTSIIVTVNSTATYCTIPKIEASTGIDSTRPIKLFLEYSFDNSNWTSILLHTFPNSSDASISCVDVTAEQSYLKESIYE